MSTLCDYNALTAVRFDNYVFTTNYVLTIKRFNNYASTTTLQQVRSNDWHAPTITL